MVISSWPIWWILSLVVVCGSLIHVTSSRVARDVEMLPECIDNSVCGYVQMNKRGVSSQRICKCPGGVKCPMVWDELDGKSVTHALDQYKYCHRAPKLKFCSRGEIAYTYYMEMSHLTGLTLINNNRIHCLCPAHHLFVRNSTKFHQYENGLMYTDVASVCEEPPECAVDDVCLAITVHYFDASSFVTRKCACPFGRHCPADVRMASERFELDKGEYYTVNCV